MSDELDLEKIVYCEEVIRKNCPCHIRPTDELIFEGDYWTRFLPYVALFDTPEKKVTQVLCLQHNRHIVVMRDKEHEPEKVSGKM